MNLYTETQVETGKLVLLFSTGHSGTKWFAETFHKPEQGVAFYHEKKYLLLNQLNPEILNPWLYCLDHEKKHGMDALYDYYWEFIHDQLQQFKIVGDASWTSKFIPEIEKHYPLHRAIGLIRNGIQVVNSVFTKSTYKLLDPKRPTGLYSKYPELLPNAVHASPLYIKWLDICDFWKEVNIQIGQNLTPFLNDGHGLFVRFEDCLSNDETILNIARLLSDKPLLTLDEIHIRQKTDVNRKCNGPRTPQAIWQKWNTIQRKSFQTICGEIMEKFNYPIP